MDPNTRPRDCPGVGWLRTAAVGALVGLIGCDDPPEVITEARQVLVDADVLGTGAITGDPILVGSSLCLELTQVRESDAFDAFEPAEHEDIAACYELSAAGSVERDGWCLAFDGAGPVSLDLLRIDCGLGASLGESFGEGAMPGEQRRAVLEGRVNGLVETVEVKWQCYEGDVEDSGCGCRSSGNSTAGWGVLALLGLAGLRRRRARSSSAC